MSGPEDTKAFCHDAVIEWHLTHRVDKVGDFIEAFTEVVDSDDVGRVRKTGIAQRRAK